MKIKELLDEYGLNYSEIRYCTGNCKDNSEFTCIKRKYRNQDIIQEVEALVRNEEKRLWMLSLVHLDTKTRESILNTYADIKTP